ncbi:MAG: regulatory protein RecX [Saprospiraceae bacterium]|nr:RecX family transcriptional regulator [Lewinella sp.]
MREPKKKYHTREQALQKLQRYCVYQDRCHAEVRTKLLSLGIYGDDLEEIIVELIGENYLNEERFARSYARGKFRFKCWGRIRITQELKSRRISDYLIRKALEEIDETEYRQALYDLLEKKLALIGTDNDFEKKQKLAGYAQRRGFEGALIWETVGEVFDAEQH